MKSIQHDSYSANVKLSLRVGDEIISVAQTGPSWLILREPRFFDSAPAELLVTVGDSSRKYPIIVRSLDGASKEVHYW